MSYVVLTHSFFCVEFVLVAIKFVRLEGHPEPLKMAQMAQSGSVALGLQVP